MKKEKPGLLRAFLLRVDALLILANREIEGTTAAFRSDGHAYRS
jgi:hypothetical protein